MNRLQFSTAIGLLCFAICGRSPAQDIRDVAQGEFNASKAKLTAAFERVLKAFDAERKIVESLQKAHKAWQTSAYADAELRAGISSRGGSAYTIDYLSNLAESFESRSGQYDSLVSASLRR